MLDNFYSTPARKGFHWPGRLLHGKGVFAEAVSLAARARAPLLVIDQSVDGHPALTLSHAHKLVVGREPGLEEARAADSVIDANEFDLVLAVGGGSTCDVAKYAALRACGAAASTQKRSSPALIAVPTIAGSGSEASRFFVLKDGETGLKRSHRNWAAVPDLTVIDGTLIASAGAQRLIAGAFDAFLHLWEPYVCRGEQTPEIDMIALQHIPEIVSTVARFTNSTGVAPEDAQKLGLASAMGGIAISNVRVGLMHTLGESLAAQVSLAHPLTLAIFFDEVLANYEDAITGRWALLAPRLDANLPQEAPWTLATLKQFWRKALHQTGAEQRIAESLATGFSIEQLCADAARDTVLLKEHPAPLTSAIIEGIARRSLMHVTALPAALRVAR